MTMNFFKHVEPLLKGSKTFNNNKVFNHYIRGGNNFGGFVRKNGGNNNHFVKFENIFHSNRKDYRFFSTEIPKPLILDFEATEEDREREEKEKEGSIFRHLFWIFPIITLLLSYWQNERREWKEELLAFRASQIALPPAPLPDVLLAETKGDEKTVEELEKSINEFELRTFIAEGEYINKYFFFLGPRTLDGAGGVQLIVPFQLTSGDVIFVNRGFIPEKLKKDPQYLIDGPQKIYGLLRTPMLAGTYTPKNEPEQNQWFWLDTLGMTKYMPDIPPSRISQIVLDLTAENNAKVLYPVAGQTRINLPNNHLNYTITWFSLSVFLSYYCLMISRGKRMR